MKVYNKTVIDWLLGQQQFCLILEHADLLPSACGFGQQISPRVKQNCCCPRTQSITVYYYVSVPVFIFKKNVRYDECNFND